MNPQQLRDVRIWAIEVVLGRNAAYNHAASMPSTSREVDPGSVSQVIQDAGLLVDFVISGT